MSLKTYLESNSTLAASGATFPALTVPVITEQTAEGYMKAMAEASIEQIKFLNAYAGLQLSVLYENIGQQHKASNIAAMGLYRKLSDGGGGEGLGLIKIPGESSPGEYESLMIDTEKEVEASDLSSMWGIQNEWIDAEISRLNAMLGLLEKAETLVPPDITDEQARGIWNKIITKASTYAAAGISIVGQAAAFLGIVGDAIIVGEFAYELYKRFWVERETLRNLPAALIKLCKMTIDLLKKIRDLPQTEENFAMRQQMATQLTERFEQQMQFYMVGQNQYTLPSTMAGGMEQITQALEQLAYSDNDIDLAGVRVSMRSKVITAG